MKNKKYWEIRNQKNDSSNIGEIFLYGDISNYKCWDEDLTPKEIDNELKAIGSMDELKVYINSGGGSVFAGMAIYNILKRADAKEKNAYVDGLAASIASVITLSADKVFMPKNAMMMIHNPSSITWGESKDMRKTADTLDKIKESIVAVYEEKTGLEEKKLNKLMDDETWLTAKDAIEMGFVDELEEDKEIEASINNENLVINNLEFDMKRYKNTPKFIGINNYFKKNIIKTSNLDEQKNKFNRLRFKIS